MAYGLTALAIVLATLPREGLAAEQLRVGVLKFGTVSWQLDTLKVHRLDAAEDVDVEVVALASTNATTVALQAGAVDMIVSDWIWVMRQRGDGADLVFTPYSSALGAVVVGAQGDIRTLSDLAGKKIGVAGGPLDKSWLILQAWTRRRTSLDLGRNVDPVFAAPPLLSEEIRRGALPAVLTFWPDAARLEAEGFRRLLAVEDVLTDLGIEHPVPLVGYVFHDTLAKQRPQAVHGFFRAVAAANGILAVSGEEWLRLRSSNLIQREGWVIPSGCTSSWRKRAATPCWVRAPGSIRRSSGPPALPDLPCMWRHPVPQRRCSPSPPSCWCGRCWRARWEAGRCPIRSRFC